MTHGGRLVTGAAVLAIALSACQGSNAQEQAGYDGPAADDPTTAALDEAFGHLSTKARNIQFWSDRHAIDRLGLVDPDARSAEQAATALMDNIAATTYDENPGMGNLTSWTETMASGGAAFSELDVRWTMVVSAEPFATTDPVTVYRLVDGVDMAAVEADLLDAGFEHTDDGPWGRFALHGQLSEEVDMLGGGVIAGRYPKNFFPEVSVAADSHLVAVGDTDFVNVSGSTPTQALDALAPPDRDEIEYFDLSTEDTCWAPVDAATSNRATPDAIRAWHRKYDIESLGRPVASALSWQPGNPIALRQIFRDEAAARSAMANRQALFRGTATRDARPVGVFMPDHAESPYQQGWRMERAGNVLAVDYHARDLQAALDARSKHGLGFDVCDPYAA